jgi:Bacteriophage HK97-gp10, putative tail-component
MAEDVDLVIDTKALEAALSQLPTKIQKQYMTQALQAAGDVILEAMVAHAPERTDEETPDSTSLPPGILKADLHAQVIIGTSGARVKVGPTEVAGHVARWQNNGYYLTSHGKKRSRKQIKQIPGKHFIEAATDEAGQAALDAAVASLSESISGVTPESED